MGWYWNFADMLIFTGGGQKLCTGRVVLPVHSWNHWYALAMLLLFVCVVYIHLKILSATGRTTLLVHTFCPPPVYWPLPICRYCRFWEAEIPVPFEISDSDSSKNRVDSGIDSGIGIVHHWLAPFSWIGNHVWTSAVTLEIRQPLLSFSFYLARKVQLK